MKDDKIMPSRYLVNTFKVNHRISFDAFDLFNFLLLAGENKSASMIMKLLRNVKGFNDEYSHPED